jgi:microcystin-dependent protein
VTDFLTFNEGAAELVANGLPATCYFLLSTKSVGSSNNHAVTETLAAADLGEIGGTGYGRKNQPEPPAPNGVASFAPMTWDTGVATDWPNNVRSVVLATGAAAAGKAICAWNLVPGGGVRNMSFAHTVETVAPTLTMGVLVGDGTITMAKLDAAIINALFNVGDLKPTGLVALPSGPDPKPWLLCDGSPVSRSVYAALYAAISTVNGAGDGSTTFNLPDFRGRSPIGAGTAVGAAGATAHALGSIGGEESHVLSVAELPPHSHLLVPQGSGKSVPNTASAQGWNYPVLNSPGAGSALRFATLDPPGTLGAGSVNATQNNSVGNPMVSAEHNNLHPFQTINWLIKT